MSFSTLFILSIYTACLAPPSEDFTYAQGIRWEISLKSVVICLHHASMVITNTRTDWTFNSKTIFWGLEEGWNEFCWYRVADADVLLWACVSRVRPLTTCLLFACAQVILSLLYFKQTYYFLIFIITSYLLISEQLMVFSGKCSAV